MRPKVKSEPDAQENAAEEPAALSKEEKAVTTATEKSKDFGPWKYRPWAGIDHWVHETTRASTFDLNKIPAAYR